MEQRSKNVKINAFMTAPRYECTWARNMIEIALQKCKIPMMVSGGVFYGQCMQMMFENAMEAGCEIALTVDFDSVFTADQVERLISVLVFRDDIDAVCAFQRRRHGDTPLATLDGVRSFECDGTPFKITTGHFGLTALKFSKFEKLAKPWFWSKPNDKNEWRDGKIDEDIWFWKQWHEAGNTVYMDPGTMIGHMEEMIAEFQEIDGELVPVHTYPKDWQKRHGYLAS